MGLRGRTAGFLLICYLWMFSFIFSQWLTALVRLHGDSCLQAIESWLSVTAEFPPVMRCVFFSFFFCYLPGCCKTLETTLRTNRRRRTIGRFVGFLGVSPRSKRMVNVFFFLLVAGSSVFFFTKRRIFGESNQRGVI